MLQCPFNPKSPLEFISAIPHSDNRVPMSKIEIMDLLKIDSDELELQLARISHELFDLNRNINN